jgi:hypothetical protein
VLLPPVGRPAPAGRFGPACPLLAIEHHKSIIRIMID